MEDRFEINANLLDVARDPEIHKILVEVHGENFPILMEKLESGQQDVLDDFHDLLWDALSDSEIVETLYGAGAYGSEFPIDIRKLGPLYWIDAQEFDWIGTFPTFDEALNYAEMEFQPYISRLDEDEEDEEDDNEESI